jgi:hypothetical protein
LLAREYQLALLRARAEDGEVALARDRPEGPGHGARFRARSAAPRTAKGQGEFHVSRDAQVMRHAAQQRARVGDAQPVRARGCIPVGIGFEFVAEDGSGLVFDAQSRGLAAGGLDIRQRCAAGDEGKGGDERARHYGFTPRIPS